MQSPLRARTSPPPPPGSHWKPQHTKDLSAQTPSSLGVAETQGQSLPGCHVTLAPPPPPQPPPPAPELVPIEGKSKWAGPSGLSPTGLCRLFPVPSLTLSVVSKTHRTEEPASSPATRCVLTRGGGRRAPGGASGASPPAPCGVLTRAASGAGRPRLLPPRAHWPPASPTLGPSAPETASRSLASARPGPAPGQMPRVAAVAAADSAGGGVGGGHPARGRRA